MSKILQRAAKARKDKEEIEEAESNVVASKPTTKPKKSKKVTVIPDGSNVTYLGHIPHGFYEKEMRGFFKQFGDVKRIKLFRSEKTGNSKGYGFVEFDTPEVAALVAESMNGYFLQGKQLVCNVIPTAKIHEGMFLPPKKRKVDCIQETSEENEQPEASENIYKDRLRAKKYCETQMKKKARLQSLGFDIAFPLPTV
jgi:nucleolar protein 15